MIVLDTSGMFAAADRDSRRHEAARALLHKEEPPLLLSPFVLAELDYLISERLGIDPALELLDEVGRGAYELVPFVRDDIARAAELVRRYRDLGIGLTDASVVLIAGRYRTTRILTLDERHLRAVKPLHGRSFKLLPADA